MRTVTAKLESLSPYSQSRHYTDPPRKDKESPEDYKKRTWRSHCHSDDAGNVVIPPMAFKNCVAEAAKFLSIKIPGERNATWTKHFEAGLMVPEPLVLPIKVADVEGEWLFLPSDGVRGGGKRVDKCYPLIRRWAGSVTFYILDEKITQEAFEYHLREAGNLIGIGRFRPRNNGYYGRFQVKSVSWANV